MQKLRLVLEIYSDQTKNSSKQYACAVKDIEVPFIPFNGLGIDLPRERGQLIEQVRWVVDENLFRCHLRPELTCLWGVADRTFEEWLEYYSEHGWHVDGPHDNDFDDL